MTSHDLGGVAVLLRAEMSALRRRETRAAFDATVYVGTLGGARDSFVVRRQDLPGIDRAVRTDVVSALLARLGGEHESAWVTRPGRTEPSDADLGWLGAASAAFAIHGRRLAGFWVITPSGWFALSP